MKAILSLYWQVLKFDRSPEDVPYSVALLLMVLAANFICTAVGQYVGKPHVAMALGLPVIAIAVELAVLTFLLHFKRLENRLVQTASAIYGCDTLLTLASIPLQIAGQALPQSSPVLGLLGLLEVVLLGWGLGLRAFIYHRASNIGLIQANMLAVAIFLLTTMVSVKVFPEILAHATAAATEAAKTKAP